MATTTVAPPSAAASKQQHPWPLYDLCLDVPHPACSKSCPPPFLIGSPQPDNALAMELEQTVPQIARFAFPDFDEMQPQPSGHRDAYLNNYDVYCLQLQGFSSFTFTLQLGTGTRMHGHVRRYLPPHLVARTRYDVGRRGERALVILTRASGADQLYAAILKSIEAISSQQAALARELQPHAEPQKWFLHQLFQYQQHLAKIYANKPMEEKGKPLIAALDGLEIGTSVPIYKGIDNSRFIIPTCLLHRPSAMDPWATQASSSILPLLRCVGVAHALRIMAALLSERRVVMVSSSPTRLANCSHAALSMLAQGILHWQHLYIPVLPPHLWQYLAAPYPYLIGILSHMHGRLDHTDGLGEVLIIQLDSNTMETRGMPPNAILQQLPDLFQQQDPQLTQLQGGAASASELLAQDLIELLKTDKKTLYGGESALANMGETAVKAGKALKGTFFKLRDKGRQYLQQRSSGYDEDLPEPPQDPVIEAEVKSMAPDYIYTEGCHNEVCEEEARIAFCTFFLNMFGNMRWYLTANPGQTPQLDRNRFLQQKRATGDGEGTPMWPLLQNFCQTQMLEEFAKARVEEVRTREPITPDAPLFLQCADYLRQHNIDYGLLSVRRIARQVAEASPGRLAGMLQTNARRMAMTLTSNKAFEGDYSKAIAQLVEQCRESTSVLFDVMSVIWLRLRDCKGMQWKHGYQALQILRNLLYHGPMAAIAEATDGLSTIRSLKHYENMRSQNAQQVRTAAANVYTLLVDRAKLFNIRRVCIDRRRKLKDPNQPRLVRDSRLRFGLPFKNVHVAMNPTAGGTVARIPPAAPSRTAQTMQRGLSGDLLGVSSPQPVQQTQPAAAADMFGLFDSMAVSAPAAQVQPSPASAPASGNPFGGAIAQPAQPVASPLRPTIVELPPAPPPAGPSYPNQSAQPPPTQQQQLPTQQQQQQQQQPPTQQQQPPTQQQQQQPPPTQQQQPPPQFQSQLQQQQPSPHQQQASAHQFPQNPGQPIGVPSGVPQGQQQMQGQNPQSQMTTQFSGAQRAPQQQIQYGQAPQRPQGQAPPQFPGQQAPVQPGAPAAYRYPQQQQQQQQQQYSPHAATQPQQEQQQSYYPTQKSPQPPPQQPPQQQQPRQGVGARQFDPFA